MGVVFRAYHAQLERTGAVKVLQAITPDPDTVARFRHEAQAIARLRHPNIVDVYDFGEFQGTPYMIVEYVPGGSLGDKMARGPLDRGTALKYLRGIAAGLDYAHLHGIVHRDIKPANVLLTSDDSPVLADFGLAKLLQGTSLKSMTGVTTGTPAYMAPEQVTGHQVGPAADRYSLATIAYEMLTGVIPFDGEGLMELLYAQVHRAPTAPSARHSALSPQVDAVVLRGLAKNPAERWESATAFVDALATALDESNGQWPAVASTLVMDPPVTATTRKLVKAAVLERPTPVRKPPATVAMEFPSPPPPAPGTTNPPSHPRRRIAMGLAALLALLLLFGVCAVAAQATTLAVSPFQVAPGGTVHVTASRVPANQAGEIQLHSVVHTYAFQADAKGEVSLDIDIPADAELGDHVVKICWDNSCRKDAPLRVVSGSTGPSPNPTGSPNATSSSSPTPGTTPAPHSAPTPRSTPTATPKSSPKPTPIRPPSPSPSPTPTSTPNPSLSVTPTTVHILTSRNITVSGSNWPAGSQVTITFTQLGVITKPIGNQNVQSNGSFSWTGGIPSAAVAGSATIKACAGSAPCVTRAITVAT